MGTAGQKEKSNVQICYSKDQENYQAGIQNTQNTFDTQKQCDGQLYTNYMTLI